MANINGTVCPSCEGNNTPVRFSGHDANGNRIRQRRCGDCSWRFTTVEVFIDASYHALVLDEVRDRGSYKFQPERDPDVVETKQCRTNNAATDVLVKYGKRKPRKMCRRGLHALTKENTVDGKPRQCRVCKNERSRRHYQEKMLAVRQGITIAEAKVLLDAVPEPSETGGALRAIDTTVSHSVGRIEW